MVADDPELVEAPAPAALAGERARDPSVDPSFPVTFEPGDEALEWEWDDMHSPRAVPALSQDYLGALAGGFAAGYRAADLPYSLLARVWNGYVYFGLRIDAPESRHDAIRASAPDAWRRLIPTTPDFWRRSRQELAEMYAEIEALTGEEPARELVAGWERAWAHTGRAWEIHFEAIGGPYQVLDDLADRYEALIAGARPADALELVAGTVPELREVERDLETLTVAALKVPAVAERLRRTPSPNVEEIRDVAGGPAFVAALGQFLDRHGHLGHMTEDLVEPSWSEDPRPLLGDIGRRLDVAPGTADRRRAERETLAERRAQPIREMLADRPTELAEFEALLAKAREIGPLTEGHNYWIDRMCADRLRRLSRRVGRRLVTAGVIDDVDDVVHLHRDEISALIEAPVDRRALVADRAAEHAANLALSPPKKLGRITPPDPDRAPDRFEGGAMAITADGNLRGTGASAGVVRAPARVVLGPQDFDKVAPGDIVIATASNPGWVPLFAIAGGFVTDTGGVLSHSAVIAREFGIPAVVGTREGTKRIVDGTTIEIDGATGIVRLA